MNGPLIQTYASAARIVAERGGLEDDEMRAMLLTDAHVPSLDNDGHLADVHRFEVEANGSYVPGGVRLARTQDDTLPVLTWRKFTGTVRYLVLFSNRTLELVALVDFGRHRLTNCDFVFGDLADLHADDRQLLAQFLGGF